ncbi:MAG: gamma-glutamyltransferase [Gemmataceae bacterium]
MGKEFLAAIAADSPLTASAGARMAELGGNAVDIAVSAGLTATVSEILMCSLGGSAFCMIRLPGHPPELIDGADAVPTIEAVAPSQSDAWRRFQVPYGDGIEVIAGHASVAVPGMLAAVELAWRRHGTLPWSEIVSPALELAKQGCPVEATVANWLQLSGKGLFDQQPASRESFFSSDGEPLKEGDRFHIPHLDQALEAIVQNGASAFYKGDLATAFVREMERNGGFVTREDLASYRAKVRKPLTLHSCGYELTLNPPPAVGGAALGTLIGLIDRSWQHEATEPEITAMHARIQRSLLGSRDSSFTPAPSQALEPEQLLSEQTFRQHLKAFSSPNTTHLSVVTRDGGMVALTMSNGYGSGVTIPGTGIPCNNSLGEPELNPLGFYKAKPGARLISNMAPTLAWNEKGTSLAFGSPGASRITTSMAQFWTNYALRGLSLQEAISAPRLHVEQSEQGFRLLCEPGIDTTRCEQDYQVRRFEMRDMFFGALQVAAIEKSGVGVALTDDRRNGAIRIVEK